jgi:hypothetical protein
MNGHFDDRFAVLHRPYRADQVLLAPFPTLKRGANQHCAYGATEIGASLANNLDLCNCPAVLGPGVMQIPGCCYRPVPSVKTLGALRAFWFQSDLSRR